MSFLIAAAGTGGHVFPGLAVGEALLAEGVSRSEVIYVGGDRLESDLYPAEGFTFIGLDLRGLKRELAFSNLGLPWVVERARKRIIAEIASRGVKCVLAMGGYATIPAGLAARKTRVPLFLAEQNAGAGVANRIAKWWASRVFISFPRTHGLEAGEWVGNPVRESFARFDRARLRPIALNRYGLQSDVPTLGVFGGSLGAAALNAAIVQMTERWEHGPMQLLHLTGSAHHGALEDLASPDPLTWVRRGFEDRMDLFYAASDLVVARAGGAVAEITATGTPSILIPGDFGSSGHQSANAEYLATAGAAVVIDQALLHTLAGVVADLLGDGDRLRIMGESSLSLARPDAAKTIAQAMIGAAS